jgi:hypothetical protein
LGLTGGTQAPTITATAYTDSDADTAGRIDIVGNKITFSGDFKAGDVYKFDVNDVQQTITLASNDAYTDDAAGVGAQVKAVLDAAIGTTIASNVTTAHDGAGTVTLTAGNIAVTDLDVNVDTITHATFSNFTATNVGGTAGVATGATSNGAKSITFGGDIEATDKMKLKVNSSAFVEVEFSATGPFALTAEGAALQMKEALEASTDANLVDLTFSTDGNGTLSVVDNRLHALTVENGNTIKISGTNFANTEKFKMKIGGIQVTTTLATDAYEDNANGASAQLAADIMATAGLKHLTVTDNGNGSVTITNPAAVKLDSYDKTTGTEVATRLDYNSGTQKLTFSGVKEFVDGTVYTANINGRDYSITANANDQFANDKDGLALQMKDAITNAGGLTAVTVGVGAAGSGEVTFTDNYTDLVTDKVIVSDAAGGNNTIALTNAGTKSTVELSAIATLSAGDTYTFKVAGQTATYTHSTTD